MTSALAYRLTEIFLPLEGEERTEGIVTTISGCVKQLFEASLGVELIDSLIAAHSITGDDLTYLQNVKASFS